jgi:hypothetical protein
MQTLHKNTVIISRYWDNPEIAVRIFKEGIQVEISLEDFCKAIVADIPHPWKTLSRAGLEADVLASIETVLNKAKESSIHT